MFRAFLTTCLLIIAPLGHASELTAPEGTVVLTITGEHITANSAEGAEFDLEMLSAMPQSTIETTTPWHDGMMLFEGPRLSEIIDLVGASGESATVTALDDYQIDIPIAEIVEKQPILALTRNGEPMPDDDQGPLFIIYDYNSDPTLDTEEIHSHSVWSVKTIDIK